MKFLDDFLAQKSLKVYLYLCFIPVLLILVVGLPIWVVQYQFFAFLVPAALLAVSDGATRRNPSEGNKVINSGLYAAVFLLTAPSTILLFPSGIPFWIFVSLGFLFMWHFVSRALSLKKQFRDGIDTPYGECMWHS